MYAIWILNLDWLPLDKFLVLSGRRPPPRSDHTTARADDHVCRLLCENKERTEIDVSGTRGRAASMRLSQIKFLFSTCYARCDGPCEISRSLGAKTYPLLHWPATGFVACSYLLRRKRVSGEITDFSMNKDAHEPYLVFFVFTTAFINQWASRIITLTFLPKSVDDESAFWVQKGTPTSSFLPWWYETGPNSSSCDLL
jgi:hypothetical protein